MSHLSLTEFMFMKFDSKLIKEMVIILNQGMTDSGFEF